MEEPRNIFCSTPKESQLRTALLADDSSSIKITVKINFFDTRERAHFLLDFSILQV